MASWERQQIYLLFLLLFWTLKSQELLSFTEPICHQLSYMPSAERHVKLHSVSTNKFKLKFRKSRKITLKLLKFIHKSTHLLTKFLFEGGSHAENHRILLLEITFTQRKNSFPQNIFRKKKKKVVVGGIMHEKLFPYEISMKI